MERSAQFEHVPEAHGQGTLFDAPEKWHDVAMTGRRMTPRAGLIDRAPTPNSDQDASRAAKETYTKVRREGIPTIRTSTDVLESMSTDEPRYKTQFETQRSRGMLDNDYRAGYEQRAFGYPGGEVNKPHLALRPQHRPVYGIVDHPAIGETAEHYGEHKMVLKPEIRHRMTTTWGDSLGGELPRHHDEGDDYHPAEARSSGPGYVEAQFHGGVQAKDIDHIAIKRQQSKTIGSGLSYQTGNDHEVRTAIHAAKRMGVPYRVYDNEYVGTQESLFAHRSMPDGADMREAQKRVEISSWEQREATRMAQGGMSIYSAHAKLRDLQAPERLSRQFTVQRSKNFRSAYDNIDQ